MRKEAENRCSDRVLFSWLCFPELGVGGKQKARYLEMDMLWGHTALEQLHVLPCGRSEAYQRVPSPLRRKKSRTSIC